MRLLELGCVTVAASSGAGCFSIVRKPKVPEATKTKGDCSPFLFDIRIKEGCHEPLAGVFPFVDHRFFIKNASCYFCNVERLARLL